MARLFLLLLGLHAGQLLWAGHWLMAPVLLLLLGSLVFAMRQMMPQDSGAARRLLLAADGRVHIATFGGAVQPVELSGASLWLGGTLLLVLRAPDRTHRLLLGRGNLDPAALATLRRRLRGAVTGSLDPAVDSRTLSGHGRSFVEQLTSGLPRGR